MKVLHHTSVIDGRSNSGTARMAYDVITRLSEKKEIRQYFLHYDDSTNLIYKIPGTEEIRLRKHRMFKFRFLYFLAYALKMRLINLLLPSQKIIFDVSHWHVFRVYPFFWAIPSKKHVITMHDAGHYLLPHTQTFANKVFILIIKLNLKKIHKILVVSEDAKTNLANFAKIPNDKIDVIYPSTEFKKIYPIKPKSIKSKLGNKKIIVCNSRWQKHKNIENLISGFDQFLSVSLDKNYLLVLAGQPREDYLVPLEVLQSSTWKKQILIMANLLDSELAWLYENSVFSVFPSLHEGFGLPVLESMSRSCPVIVDKNTATKEIVAEGGIAIDMKSVETISETLLNLTGGVNRVLGLRKLALKRSFDFNWENSIDKLVAIYS